MPTNNPIPTATPFTVIPAATQNDMAVLNTAVGLYGVGPGTTGTPPAANAPNFLVQTGYTLVTLSAGTATISFPLTFPNGLLSFVGTVNNASGASQLAYNGGGGATGAGVSIALYGPTGTPASGSHYVSWIAIGW